MTDLQTLGPIGSALNLRDVATHFLIADGFQPPDPHFDVQLQTIPGGTVIVSRYDTNYKEIKGTLLVRGATRTERRANLLAVQHAIENAVLYSTSQGRRGAAAFYQEQYGDEPSPTVYPLKAGHCKEKSRQLFWQQTECEFYLLLEPEL